ncbi:hypothetical protein [Burkholderia gladioli]|uniref:hypothetical protein n=1 Tax=Burkholderia gladioli TaxID=28095 RepID=UPI00163F3015|nr:hypothetical protein [Burkholderia gladioli]MBU9641771.1 hypothetical protein [Burkholderia gladioli]MDN7495185.1 hypothetical protein [Burkholderia gladioli]
MSRNNCPMKRCRPAPGESINCGASYEFHKPGNPLKIPRVVVPDLNQDKHLSDFSKPHGRRNFICLLDVSLFYEENAMPPLVNLKIGDRLAMGFAISVGLVGAIGAMAIWQIGKVHQKTDEIPGAILPTVQALSDVRSMGNTVRRATLRGLPTSWRRSLPPRKNDARVSSKSIRQSRKWMG